MNQPRVIRVIIDHLPYSELMPNALRRTFWTVRSEMTKVARQEAYLLGLEQTPESPFKYCAIEEIFTVPDKRRRDLESLLAASKAFIDGLVDAGIIEDDNWQHVLRLSGSVVYQKGVAQTEIIITEVK